MNINLTKKAVGDGHIRLSECGTHITNGHWAVRRELLRQAPLLGSVEAIQAMFPRATVDTVPASSMEEVRPRYGCPVTFTKTRWVQVEPSTSEVVLFVAEDGSQAWVDRRFVDLFKLDEVIGESDPGKVTIAPLSVGEGADFKILVMPKRLDYQEGLR